MKTATEVLVSIMETLSDAEPDACIVVWASGKTICYESNCRHFEALGLLESAKSYLNGTMQVQED